MQLFIITPPEGTKEKALLTELVALYPSLWIHVRKPNASHQEIHSYIKDLPISTQKRCLVHQTYQVYETLPIGGIHLSEKAKLSQSIQAQVKEYKQASPSLRLSHAAHSIDTLNDKTQQWDCVFLSPIFNCISKQAKSAFDATTLQQACKIHKNVVALGGCDAQNLHQLKQLGFYGAAFLGALWQADNVLLSWKHIIQTNCSLT